jgi:hypothetical protein
MFLCLVRREVADGQSISAADDAPNKPDQIALYVGISKQLARLRDLSIQPTPENSADRMWLHQDILEAVTAGSLQVDATIEQIDFEISSVNAFRGSLSDASGRIVNRLNLAGLVAGGSLGTVSSGLQLSQSQAHSSALIGISAGVLSSGFALAGIRAQKGRSQVFSSRSNMLAELFGREALPGSQYPEAVEAFLNQVPLGATDTRSRGAHSLPSRWRNEEQSRPLPQRVSVRSIE